MRYTEKMKSHPWDIMLVAVLMILFGLAEVATSFTHSFLGLISNYRCHARNVRSRNRRRSLRRGRITSFDHEEVGGSICHGVSCPRCSRTHRFGLDRLVSPHFLPARFFD